MKLTPLPARAIALVVGSVLGAAGSGAWAAESLERSYVDAQQEAVEVFVRLTTPSVSELNIASLASTGRWASRDAQIAQAQRVDAEQAAFRDTLAAFGATELSAQRVGANGLRVSVPASQIDALKSLPGVRSVGRVELHEIANVTSVPWTGAAALNATGLTGAGIRVGIIDTGIDYTHANFGGPGTAAAYSGNNRNIVEPGTFPTAKVVGGYDFAGPTYNAQIAGSVPAPDPDPIDGNGHGSHVAGTAAGFGVPGTVGAGVAPDALLYALKVFSDAGGSTGLTSLAIEWAMDPNGDGDMSDHLDVINMSLGSSFGEPADPSAISSNNAAAAGIIVVTSAGNSGNIPYVTGAPGVAHSAISTAANVPGGRNFSTLNIDAPASVAGPKFNEEGTSPSRVSSVAPLTDTVVEADPLIGCTPLTNGAAVNGNIVLMQRGTCTFQVKSANALAAGARAVIMVNNAAGDPIVMGAITALIPGVMISLADGTPLIAAATTDAASPVVATLGFGPDPTKADRIASFSSRGPASASNSSFKPDLAAPGVGIVSTAVGTGTGGASNQGTSMASPHVAGAAALLRQKYPHLAQYGVKALLQNSTVDVNPSNAADTSLARNGVGSMRVDAAAALSSFATPGGVSFGRINPTATTSVSETVYLNNMKGGTRTFNVTHVPRATYPGVQVTCPASVTVGRQAQRPFTIKLRFDPRPAAEAGIFDNASVSQREVDGWCVLSDGTDSLRVGYLAVVDSASGMIASPSTYGLNIRNKGPAVGFAEGFTWVGSGGTGADDTYGSIAHLGVRRGNPARYSGLNVVEFGLAVDRNWDHISNLAIDLYIDADKNGTDDFRLVARDWTSLSTTGVLGTYVTAQFVVGGAGFLDWIVGQWDFNDRVVVLPFTAQASGGRVPNSFNYRLVIADRQGNSDVQTGTIDLANEIVPDLNSFGLASGESAPINVSASGQTLWLFPNNHDWVQDWVIWAQPGSWH